MSAILFKPEEMDTQLQCHEDVPSPSTTTINETTTTTTSISQICDELIADAMSALELNETTSSLLASTTTSLTTQTQSLCCDGSDSGVEIATTHGTSSNTLQRALSSNSGGYTSSNGGCCADESLNTNNTGQNISCNSSLISCSSDLYELKVCATTVPSAMSRSPNNSYECCSENGSESSSVLGRATGTMTAATGANTPARRVNGNGVKKKVAMFEPHDKTKESGTSGTPTQSTRGRMNTLKRAVSLPRSSHAAMSQVRNQRQQNTKATTSHMAQQQQQQQQQQPMTPTRAVRPQKPDTLPSALSRTQSISMQRLVQRTPSLSRARTPGTPSDDGRWPATTTPRGGAARRGLSVTPDLAALKMRTSMLAVAEGGVVGGGQRGGGSPSPYGTLPRRRKQQSVEDLTAGGRGSRSNSITRESRMTSSVVVMPTRKSLAPTFAAPAQPARSTSRLSVSNAASMRKPQQKTRIYHEIAVQTALTSHDLEQVFSGGVANARAIDAVEQREQSTQSDIRDMELERLRDELRQVTQREHDLSAKLQREREEKLTMQRELHLNTERVMGMLEMARVVSANAGTPTSEDGSGHDSLLMLESQIQMSGHELIERQHEIGQLRQLCRSLQLEMQRSLAAQECLLQEKAAMEQESSEMQDFLQHEKAAMCDALKELEADYQNCKQQLTNREEEVKVLRDECRHLVRLNEQRRQENRLLQTKYAALESKSKDMLMQQSASVSGASSALAGLQARLDNLVEQLVYSYSISEQDLEDIGFQNEANSMNGNGESLNDNTNEQQQNGKANANGLELPLQQGGGGGSALHALALSSDGSLSPQRNQSFIAAVISAIRNATTTHSGKRLSLRHGKRAHLLHSHTHQQHGQDKQNGSQHEQVTHNGGGDDSDSTEMLDSETEPCLMMDNVLEDVVQPDSHSHNMVSSTCTGMISQIELPSELVNVTNGDDSLQQLSQAITNRQQMEQLHMKLSTLPINGREQCNTEDLSCHDSLAELPSLMEYSSTQAVVDQVIEVDTLVTKLLKVLRLIQLDNDNCIQQLIVDKNKLQQHKEDMLEKLKDLEDVNIKLQDELMDATQELMLKGNDLSSAKAEMQRHRNEIDRLNEDICTLSTLCSNYKKLSPTTEFPPMQLLTPIKAAPAEEGDVLGILNLLKMWQAEGQLQDTRVYSFLRNVCGLSNGKNSMTSGHNNNNNNEARLRIYANQLENVLKILSDCTKLEESYPALQQLRKEIECVKLNASWTHVLNGKCTAVETKAVEQKPSTPGNGDDFNANARSET